MRLSPGSTFAHYRVESRLGEGGVGIVYLAADPILERKVALKVLHPALAADADYRARFVAEARAAAGLDHPHVLPVYEAGEHEGLLYLAMRYVPGFDLGTLIAREGALPLARTMRFVTQIAFALDAAHARGLVHRDVKPTNALIAPGEHAYLADFGLARPAGPYTSGLTQAGQLVGSVDYLAPELVSGGQATARSDTYALGCLLVECLTGTPPFRHDTEIATLYAQVHDPIPMLSDIRPGLPAGIDAVLLRALAKRAEERFGSATELAEALEVAASGVLVATPPAPSPAPIQAITTSVERKLVSVLFADIVGSSALGVERDAEVVRATLGHTFDAMRDVLQAHGGTVEKFIGDSVMAVFGVPRAHEDDADRAVRAAFGLLSKVGGLNAGARIRVELRIGVNTGEAVAGAAENAERLVTGAVVNVGARLQQAANPGEILVGALTQRLTKRGVRYGIARAIEAKGIGGLEAWPAVDLLTTVPEEHRGFTGMRAPLVGRERELRVLEAAYARVRAESTPSLVTVFGSAGAGKSRLMVEFVDRIGASRVRIGRCLPYGEGITFYALRLILRAECGIELTDSRLEALGKLERAVQESFEDMKDVAAVTARVAVIAGLAEPVAALPDLGEQSLPQELRWGIRRFFERRARHEPLVLVFEDLHWAETGLVELVEDLTEWSRAPLLILGFARPEFREGRPSFASNAANATTITLAPLTADDIRRLIAELLTLEDLPKALHDQVVTRAEGNPLYVEEFLQTLVESDRIERRDGRWVAIGDLEPLVTPPTLVGLITARLDRVRPAVKRLLQHASLAGRLFSTSALEAIGAEAPNGDLLREAVQRDLIVEADDRAVGSGRAYRFKHVLIRDVAYSTVPKAERLHMHDRYSRWLEATLGDRSAEFAGLIFYHAEQAYQFARELGHPETKNMGRRALVGLLDNATETRQRGDWAGARALYERAAIVAEEVDASLAERAEAQGFAVVIASSIRADDTPELRRAYDEAIALAERAGPSEVLVKLLTRRARRALQDDEHQAPEEFLERAIAIAREIGDPLIIADALVWRTAAAYWRRDMQAFHLRVEEAYAFIRAHDVRGLPLQNCLAHLMFGPQLAGNFTEALEYMDARLATASSKFQEAQMAQDPARIWLRLGHPEKARVFAKKGVDTARDLGLPYYVATNGWRLGEALLELGEPAKALEYFEEAIKAFRGTAARDELPEVFARAARASVRLGDLETPRRYLDEARRVGLTGDLEADWSVTIAEAEYAEARADFAVAESAYRDIIARLEPTTFKLQVALTKVRFARFLIGARRAAEARPLLRDARAFFHDPLAERRRAEIDALFAETELAAPYASPSTADATERD